jgi:hypothetical protein
MDGNPAFPKGIQIATLVGDPTKVGRDGRSAHQVPAQDAYEERADFWPRRAGMHDEIYLCAAGFRTSVLPPKKYPMMPKGVMAVAASSNISLPGLFDEAPGSNRGNKRPPGGGRSRYALRTEGRAR